MNIERVQPYVVLIIGITAVFIQFKQDIIHDTRSVIPSLIIIMSVFYFSMFYLRRSTTKYKVDSTSVLKSKIEKVKLDEHKSNAFKDESEKTHVNTEPLSIIIDECHTGNNKQLICLSKNLENTKKRLYNELNTLQNRAMVNLSIGITITVVAIGILTHFVTNESLPKELDQFLIYSLPKVFLFFFIELFAYFFLQMYKTSLSEVKYIHNELTNIEHKQLALIITLNENRTEPLDKVIEEFISTERNRFLEKGQSAYEIERNKLENQNLANIMNFVTTLLSKNSKNDS